MVDIRNANIKDIDRVVEIERCIERDIAATRNDLLARLSMFPDGFLVAVQDRRVVGYVESCLWDKVDIKTFAEISDFPRLHKPDGRNLYIIFLGVAPNYRGRGIGGLLVTNLQNYAGKNKLEKVQLVSSRSLHEFYERLGFQVARELPDFLPRTDGSLMEWRI